MILILSGTVIEPTRWLSATLFPVLVAWWGLKKKSISFSGAVCGELQESFVVQQEKYIIFFVSIFIFTYNYYYHKNYWKEEKYTSHNV